MLLKSEDGAGRVVNFSLPHLFYLTRRHSGDQVEKALGTLYIKVRVVEGCFAIQNGRAVSERLDGQ